LKTVSDFSKTGLSSESGTVKTHQKLGLEIKPDYERYNILGNKKTDTDFSEGTNNISFNTDANFSKCDLSTELENIKV
jgi:hypothetical protein